MEWLKNKTFSQEEKLQWLRLYRTENIGPISFFHLLKRYGSASEAIERLPEMTRWSKGTTQLRIPTLDEIKYEYQAHEAQGYHLISYMDPLYPSFLKEIQDAPPFMSAYGRLELLSGLNNHFAIVGSRNSSYAGKKITETLVEGLGKDNFVIVSGMARGIDTWAHKSALKTGTIAVLAGGIDVIYPLENRDLYYQIAESGLLLSEAPLGTPAQGSLFPRRNRIISGLSWGVLVIEAGIKSGSLLTARYALDQGRQIFAVPGHPLDPRSGGANSLLKQGAQLVEEVEDVLNEYVPYETKQAFAEESEEYRVSSSVEEISVKGVQEICKRLLEILSVPPVSLSELLEHLEISPPLLQAALVELEILGHIDRYPGGYVCLSPESDILKGDVA